MLFGICTTNPKILDERCLPDCCSAVAGHGQQRGRAQGPGAARLRGGGARDARQDRLAVPQGELLLVPSSVLGALISLLMRPSDQA